MPPRLQEVASASHTSLTRHPRVTAQHVVTDVTHDVRSTLLISTYEARGMVVRRFSQSDRKKEPLSSEGHEVFQYLMQLVRSQNVTPEDILFIELVDGFIIDIPRMERSMVFRDQIMMVRTPTHIRSGSIDEKSDWKSEIQEVMMFNIKDREMPGGIIDTTQCEKNVPKSKIDMTQREISGWMYDEISKRSKREITLSEEKNEANQRKIIDGVRGRFPTAASFITCLPENMRRVKVNGLTVNEVGTMHGIQDPAEDLLARVYLAAVIYGEGNPTVQKALATVLKPKLQLHERNRVLGLLK